MEDKDPASPSSTQVSLHGTTTGLSFLALLPNNEQLSSQPPTPRFTEPPPDLAPFSFDQTMDMLEGDPASWCRKESFLFVKRKNCQSVSGIGSTDGRLKIQPRRQPPAPHFMEPPPDLAPLSFDQTTNICLNKIQDHVLEGKFFCQKKKLTFRSVGSDRRTVDKDPAALSTTQTPLHRTTTGFSSTFFLPNNEHLLE